MLRRFFAKTIRLSFAVESEPLLKTTNEIISAGACVAALTMALIASIPTARADDFRVGAFIGGSIANNEINAESATANFGGSVTTFTNTYEADKKIGFLAGVTAGIETDEGFIFEGEAAYRRIGFDAIGALSANVGGVTQALPAQGSGAISGYSLMANGWYDFLNRGSQGIRPFAGGGVGVAIKKSSGAIQSQGPLFGLTVNNTTGLGNNQETDFAWQAGAGLRTNLSKNMTASLSYRYFDGGEVNDQFDFTMHSIVFGVSF